MKSFALPSSLVGIMKTYTGSIFYVLSILTIFYKDSSYWCYYAILQYNYKNLRSNQWIVRILVQILCLLYFTKIRCKYVNFRQSNIFHYSKQLSNRKEFLNIRVKHFQLVHVCQFTNIYELVYYVCILSIYFKMSKPKFIKNG